MKIEQQEKYKETLKSVNLVKKNTRNLRVKEVKEQKTLWIFEKVFEPEGSGLDIETFREFDPGSG